MIFIKDTENGKKKMGRPTENPRTKKITFRISEAELEAIQMCADKTGKHRIDVVMEGIGLLKEKLGLREQ